MAIAMLVASLATFARPACAQSVEEARREFDRAVQAYESGRFLEAALGFEAAHALTGRPEILYNVYVAYRDANERTRAAAALRRYLAESEHVEDRALFEARLAALERGEPEDRAEPAPPLEAALPDEAPSERASAGASSERTPSTTDAPRTEGPGPWAIGLMVGGGVAVLTSAITGGLALGEQAGLADACPRRVECDPELESVADDVVALAAATDVLIAVGVVALGVGVILWIVGAEGAESPVACGPSGCALGGRF